LESSRNAKSKQRAKGPPRLHKGRFLRATVTKRTKVAVRGFLCRRRALQFGNMRGPKINAEIVA
jgi:hypothetical protein